MRKSWSDEAIKIYGCIQEQDGVSQLKTAEKFLNQHQNNAALPGVNVYAIPNGGAFSRIFESS